MNYHFSGGLKKKKQIYLKNKKHSFHCDLLNPFPIFQEPKNCGWQNKFWTLVLSKTPVTNKSILQVENLLFSYLSTLLRVECDLRKRNLWNLCSFLFINVKGIQISTQRILRKRPPPQKNKSAMYPNIFNKDNYKSNSFKMWRLNSLMPRPMSGNCSIVQVVTRLYDNRKPAPHLRRLNAWVRQT